MATKTIVEGVHGGTRGGLGLDDFRSDRPT